MKTTMQVKFREWKCEVWLEDYARGGKCVQGEDALGGGPVATGAVGGAGLEKGEVAIKDYSENEGMLKVMMDAGIVSAPVRYVESGFVRIPVCKLLI